MAIEQEILNKALYAFIARWASLSLTSKHGRVTLVLSTTLGHLSTPPRPPLKPLKPQEPEAPAPGPPASEPSASGPPTLGRTWIYWT